MPEFSRLPRHLVPKHYTIHLHPNLNTSTFSGECEVSLVVQDSTNQIVCNASCLEIKEAVVSCEGASISPTNVEMSEEQETLTLTLQHHLSPGHLVTVKYTFSGILNDNLMGLYRSKYTVDGQQRYAAVTQFESTGARQAFPCWDEPALKATFDMTITAPSDRVVLSNMPEISSRPADKDPSLKTVYFDRTPIMSTYLVAIVVGEFDYVEGVTEEGIAVKVFTPLGKKEQGTFALECGVKALTFFSHFFNLAYPLKKYDMVAIPDFSAGAMENWGLVTYREVSLLVDPLNTSASGKERVAVVVCHETAHQWFGNLVTMEWWTHLWLNEGFASFMENLTTDSLYPNYHIWDQFVPKTLIEALKLDALSSSHPIEIPVGRPCEVDEIFDKISYNKGASIIRMLYDWIGNKNFRLGMSQYLTKYAYKNAETPQLWAELEAASGQPVTAVMETWTRQMGFPLVSLQSRQEGPDRILTLSQSKFQANGERDTSGRLWAIPLSICWAGGSHSLRVILDRPCMEVRLPGVNPGAWVKLNPGFVGFYRVAYARPDLELLCSAVRTKAVPHLDRLNIVDDVFSLVTAGQLPTVEGLNLLQAYQTETSYVVWSKITDIVATLTALLADQACLPHFNQLVCKLYSEVRQQVSWEGEEGESHLMTLLRSLVIATLGKAGDNKVRAEAKKRFDLHASGKKTLCADLRSAVYLCVACMGKPEDYETMIKLHRDSDLPEEKQRLVRDGLANFANKQLLSQALSFSISEAVRGQDSAHFIGAIARNPQGRDISWQFFTQNFNLLKNRYSKSGFLLSFLTKAVSERFLTVEKAAMIEQFFRENPLPGSERSVAQAVETIRVNAAWLARDGAQLNKYLAN